MLGNNGPNLGDNARPHQDGDYYPRFMMDFCKQKGWKWEPQVPQMQYVNNLELYLFPMMSK
jgi:hypothetical protein